MAELKLDYYNDDTGYSDGDIEQELLEVVKNNNDFEEYLKTDHRWPVFYHLSPRRENILNWYPFKENAEILEIGSGCGALTGLLSQKAGKVTSVELTKPRADVNFERNKDKDNVDIYVGNFNNMDFGKKFDYVILNGVLEYAISFTDSENPFEDFLEEIKKVLKDDGEILIAIENRLGLKYFNGVPEDHTAQLFSGLDGYPHTTNVKTFTKKELTDLLNRVGLEGTEFYYPTPDYKFPNTIYTDASTNLVDNRVETNTFMNNRLRFFDESEVLRTLVEENIVDRFFNSFLVSASRKPKETDRKVIFSKISDRRKKDYQVKTSIIEENGIKKVTKEALTPKAQPHLDKMEAYFKANPKNGKYKNVGLKREGETLVFDFVEGPTFETTLLNLLNEGKYKEFEEKIKEYSNELYKDTELRDDYQTDSFKEIFGKAPLKEKLHVKKDSNIDLIFSNIIESDEETIIDYEWIFDFDIPQEFVIWRGLYYFYLNNHLQNSKYSLEDLMKIAGINPELKDTFIAWDEYFGNTGVVDSNDTLFINSTIDAVPILSELLGSNDNRSSLYLDFGEGDSEENRILRDIKFDGENFEVTFDLKKALEDNSGRLKHLRWDPVEQACQISDLKIKSNTNNVDIYDYIDEENQKFKVDDWIYFFTNDPQLEILGDYEGLEEITISGKLKYFNKNEIIESAERLSYEIQKNRKDLKALEQAIKDKEQHIKNLENIIAVKENGTL